MFQIGNERVALVTDTSCDLSDEIFIYCIYRQTFQTQWQFFLCKPLCVVIAVNLKRRLAGTNSLFIPHSCLIFSAIFQQEQDVIRYLSVNQAKDILIKIS